MPHLHSGDEFFCPLEGHTFTCRAVVFVTQENMNDAQLHHEIGVTAKTASGDKTLEERYNLHVKLEGESAVVIGE